MGNMTNDIAENAFSMIEDTDIALANELKAFPGQMEDNYCEIEGDAQNSHSFMELYEQSLKGIQEGKVVNGEIVQVDSEYVLVDIGYKSEGQIPVNEFMNSDGRLTAQVGQKVDVLLVRKEDKEGRIILSREKAAAVKIWDDVEEIYKNHGTVRGKILSRVNGGLSVDVGLQAFLPGSQVDLRPVRNLDALIGTENDFMIIKYERRQGNIVLSRAALLEEERKILREKTLELLKKDAILKGIVRGIADFGLFVDLGGIDGLVHINDISWHRVQRPSDIFSVGDELTVKVLNFDKEKERVSLGIKQLTPDPWDEARDKYAARSKITGRVVALKEYGAFVEIEDGLEGLVHVSEMSWTGKIRHPSQILTIGDELEVMILDIDSEKKRISLSIKQLQPNPWENIDESYPIGTTIEGKIKNITNFGIFIGIDEGIDGLVHVSDMTWDKSLKQPSELYKKGQAVQAVVLNIDKKNERFSLGIKQLTPDPWDVVTETYKPGTLFEGIITNITDFGLFVKLESGIEGLVHISELPVVEGDNPLSGFQVGDAIETLVTGISRKDKKIRLSLQKPGESAKENIYSYVSSHKGATSNLGEIFKEEMANKKDRNLS